MAFLYCVYGERERQTINQLLGSVIQQLLLQQSFIPEDVRALYTSHKRVNTHPNLGELSRCLGSVVSLFPKVYIVIDALDECDDENETRTYLLAQLQKLETHVHLFFTSRPLENILVGSKKFEVRAQEGDMRKYLNAQIERKDRLNKMCVKNNGLRDNILNKIIAKADGMLVCEPNLLYIFKLISHSGFSLLNCTSNLLLVN